MAEPNLTVRAALLAPSPNDPPQAPDRWTTLKQRFRAEVKSIQWMVPMPDVAEMLGELFDIPIPTLLLSAWRKADELTKLLKESESSPEEKFHLELSEHTIERNLHPYIEIRIAGAPPKRLKFTLSLTFRITGFVLKVQAGEITEIRTARCYLKGAIIFEGVELLRKEFEPIDLPGSIPVSENRNRTLRPNRH
ncbi:MAG TPA: hypothetical protein VFU37_04965 [Pyrinomonadaceae bacterium]|nr:hypothetical protein [Pyrinomonadaceae bacterium]